MSNKEIISDYFSTVRIDHFEGTIGSLAQMISRKYGKYICPTELHEFLMVNSFSEVYSIQVFIKEQVYYVEITKTR